MNATLNADQRRNLVFARNLGDGVKMYDKKRDDGQTSLIIEGKPIFRSGTFSDSRGIEHQWEPLHMSQMVDHFTLLKSREQFEDIPVRKGHPDWGGIFSDPVRNAMDELIGYMDNFRTEDRKNPTDGNTYNYFLADLEILDEEAIKKIKSGLWRNVSAEIGTYVTNANSEFWPVMMGVAYVDQPAVEGLKSQHSKAQDKFSIILEDNMTGPAQPGREAVTGSKQEAQSFSIGGKATTDYAAVQAHITSLENSNSALEQFRSETLENARVSYVKSLVGANKIAAPDEEGYLGYVKGLTPESFAAWKDLMDKAAPIAITSPQAAGFSSDTSQLQDGDEKEQRIASLKATVANHQLANTMSKEDLMNTNSYKQLIALEPSFSL